MRASDQYGGLSARFSAFSDETSGSSPLYERLADAGAEQPAILEFLTVADEPQRRPNLLFAAVHDLLLRGSSDRLADYYPSVGGNRAPDAAAVSAFIAFCDRHRGPLRDLISRRSTQTNEVRRSAVLLLALVEASRRTGRNSLALIEVGASAGLNLLVDRYSFDYGTMQVGAGVSAMIDSQVRDGLPLPDLSVLPEVAYRVGIDQNPLDPTDPEDARWLRACIWPEHLDRLRLLDAALDQASSTPPQIRRGGALDVLAEVVEGVPAELALCLFHSATLAYFQSGERTAFVDLLGDVARQRPLVWISFEGAFLPPFDRLNADHELPAPDDNHFLLGMTQWSEGRRDDTLLARGDPHGRWIQWLATSR